MPSIRSIGVALPEFSYSLDEVREVGSQWLGGQTQNFQRFDRFLTASKVMRRNFVLPASEVLALGGMSQRRVLFEQFAPRLGLIALQEGLRQADVHESEIDSFVFTSCSCPSIPSIDALIIDQGQLPRTVSRIPIFQQGCAGGVVGLSLGARLSETGKTVALTSVELCSLVFQGHNPTDAQLVGAAIFADGAASAIITPDERGMVVRGSRSYLVPETRHLMGYDLLDDGFHLRLDRDLPSALVRVAPIEVRDFLSQYSLQPEQIKFWLFHPGGIKILDFLESSFELSPHQAPWSRRVLQSVGNLSSATVLHVMRSFMDDHVAKHGDKIVMLGVGPGLTLELMLFEWIDS